MKLKSLLVALTVVACSLAGFTDIVPFKDVFPFKFGTCINGRHLYSLKPEVERVIAGSFNTVTPENELKPESVQPREGVWRFDAGDRYVAFAEKHGMKPIGHCLVWHQQTGRWMFRDEKGGPATRERLIARMKTHIQTVVGRYKGRIKGWDVVNEVFGGDGRLHRSPWLDIVGPDFIELAFTFAHEADPACELYYNDYNMDNPRKRAGGVKMIRDFKRKGIRIDGVGMQSHHRLRSPNLKDYEDSIAAFAAEGVKVMITELDISVLPAAWGLSAEVTSSQDYAAKYDPYRSGLPDAKQKELSDRYVELFKIYLRHAKEIDRVTFWGFCDRDSWLNNFPVRGRTDYPLLYDRALKPKPCAQAIFDLAKGTRAAHGGEVVLFDAASVDPSTVHAQDGATFKLANGLLTVTTAPSDRYPGFTVSGNWDLSACGEIEVEFVNGGIWGQYTVRLLNQDGVPAGKGCYIAKMPVKNEKHKLASQPIPPVLPEWSAVVSQLTRVRTWALPYLVWDTDRADVSVWHTGGVKIATLDPAHVAELAVYINTPKLPHTWSVRRIVAKGTPRAVQVPAFAKLPPEKFFPCIDAYGQFIHREWPDKVHSDADFAVQRAKEERDLAAHPGPDGWDKWGGWAAGPQLEATGGFRTTKWNGKWWIVDPDGHLWWSHGPVRVTPSCATTALDGHENWFARLPAKDEPEAAFYSTRDQLLFPYYARWKMHKIYDFSAQNIARKYGPGWYETWSALAHRRLRSWGCNTIANSSDKQICLMGRTPYTDRYEIHSRPIAGHKGGWWDFCDPFDPSFRAEARRKTVEYREQFEDPWCFGFFVDNEHSWGGPTTFALSTLKSPSDQPCKVEFRKRLQSKYGDIAKLNAAWKTRYQSWDEFLSVAKGLSPASEAAAKADLEAFTEEIAETYYRIIREELKRAAPGKLYLGCRWAGGAPVFTVKAAAKYCDVLSYNLYRKHLREFKLPDGIDKPVLVGEFHFGALDRGPFCPGLILLKDQEERGKVYEDYVRSALEHPLFVGVHWHQFSDQATSGRFDGENMQVGWTDVCDTPYWETIAGIRKIGYSLYSVRGSTSNR